MTGVNNSIGWRKINPEDLLIQVIFVIFVTKDLTCATEIWHFSGLEIQQRKHDSLKAPFV